jgi:glycosyltransferase involved in cell wall biosynthesis
VPPDISVVIPTKDRRELLTLTLRTVCEQKNVDLEVIVVDDGSAGTAPVDVVTARADPRVRLIRNRISQGVSATRNYGITEAVGRWVAFCDDDDLWAPNKLSEQIGVAQRTGRSWVYTGAVKIDATSRVVGGEPPEPPEVVHSRLPGWTLIPGGCSGVMVRRDLLLEVGGFDLSLVNLADWDLWSRLAQLGPPAWVPLPLTGYRVHSGNSSQDTSLVLHELDLLDGRYGAHVDRAAVHHYLAWVSLRGGRRRQAGRHFIQAAIRGDVVPVGRSLWGLVLQRIPGLRTNSRHSAWREQAEQWLEPLR